MLSQIVQSAQQRVTAEWQQFEEEAAKTEQWKQEQRLAEGNMEKQRCNPDADGHIGAQPLSHSRVSTHECEDRDSSTTENGAAPAPWQLRIQALLTILENEEAASTESDGASAIFPRSQLIVQLRELATEVEASVAATSAAVVDGSGVKANGGHGGESSQPNRSIEAKRLSEKLAEAQLEGRQENERQRRTIEDLEARVAAAEAETLDRMQIVAESVEAESAAAMRARTLEEELSKVRTKAGARTRRGRGRT